MATMGLHFLMLVVVATTVANSTLLQGESDGPRPIRDGFRLIVSDIDEEKVQEEITDFTQYRCEKMVVIRNRAQSDFKLTCRSGPGVPKVMSIQPGNAFVFSFRPLKNEATKIYCTLEYKQHISRFDLYNENSTYMCPRELEEVYQYTVTHEGVFVDGKEGTESIKIRALSKGHNKYLLWEEFANNETDGYLMSALIDGGMCDDIPDQFNDKTAAVTLCYNHCIHMYEHTGCTGHVQTVQANEDCIDTPLDSELVGKLSSIKGC